MVSKKTKAIIGAAAASAAIAGLIYGAKKLHDKGYDKTAVKRLKAFGQKLHKEAEKLEATALKKMHLKKAPKKKTAKKKTAKRKPAKKKKK